MKHKLLLCLFLFLILSPIAMTQKDSADQETRLTHIEVTLEQMDQRISRIEGNVSRIDGHLDTLIMWVVGLLAASFISIFVLILQIKTQLSELNAKFGLLQKDISTLNEKVDGLEKRVDRVEERFDGLEERVDGIERRIGAQLSQIQKALAKQLGMDLDDEPLT